ncbi:MAG TPA: hypothetical protein VEU55_06520 [Gemmatimonadales bacterium]|nr:hypothetical protein [Gemmatimonadales bacterium]
MHPISLSVTTLAGSTTPGTSAAIQIGSGANSLTINQAQVVLSRIELSTSSPCATTGEEDDCNELEVGPTLVTLPVDGSTKVVLDGAVPAGTYTALHAKLDAVRPDDDEPGASAFLAAHPAFQGVSVQVTGVFTDASNQTHPFTFTSAADAEIEASFEPAVTVGTNASNLTIDVNVASWFKDATGAVIDPTNTANAATIVQNIARSFRAFEDDDHDGVDDRQEQTGGHE